MPVVAGECNREQAGRVCEEGKGMQLFFALPSPFWELVEDARQRLLHHMTRPFDSNEVKTVPNRWTGVLCVAAFKMAVELSSPSGRGGHGPVAGCTAAALPCPA